MDNTKILNYLALAMVSSLGEPEKYKDVLAVLTAKAEKAKKRQAEAKAHQRNKTLGRTKGDSKKK